MEEKSYPQAAFDTGPPSAILVLEVGKVIILKNSAYFSTFKSEHK